MPNSARVAIVTGSNSGIGRAVAEALAGDGFDIGITFHCDSDGAERTAAAVRSRGRHAQVRQLDLTALPAAEVIDELAAALGGLDVLVNNAGVIAPARFLHLNFDTWRDGTARRLAPTKRRLARNLKAGAWMTETHPTPSSTTRHPLTHGMPNVHGTRGH